MKFKKRHLFFVVLLIGNLLCLEIALQVLAIIFPKVDSILSNKPKISRSIDDSILEHRPNPDYPEHDLNGFRNNNIPDKCSIVALGDSQTYGIGVRTQETWPYLVGERASICVYNMAFGGYGPVHSFLLLDEAFALRPELIIMAFYSGNDAYDSYMLVYKNSSLEYFKTRNEYLKQAMAALDKKESYGEKIYNSLAWKSESVTFREYLSQKSKLYGLLRALKRCINFMLKRKIFEDVNECYLKKEIKKDINYGYNFHVGKFNTIFTPKYRLCAVDFDDSRMAEGHSIALEAIRLMHERCKEKNIKFALVLIPTKEMIFSDTVFKRAQAIPEAYESLIDNEKQFWESTKEFMKNHHIFYIDTLPALQRYIDRSIQPYYRGIDGHPNIYGHRAIAELVLSEIKRKNFINITKS